MTLKRAKAYLAAVIDKKEIVPFVRYKYGVGRKAQVKQWGLRRSERGEQGPRHRRAGHPAHPGEQGDAGTSTHLSRSRPHHRLQQPPVPRRAVAGAATNRRGEEAVRRGHARRCRWRLAHFATPRVGSGDSVILLTTPRFALWYDRCVLRAAPARRGTHLRPDAVRVRDDAGAGRAESALRRAHDLRLRARRVHLVCDAARGGLPGAVSILSAQGGMAEEERLADPVGGRRAAADAATRRRRQY
eukprot:ctg_1837.g541